MEKGHPTYQHVAVASYKVAPCSLEGPRVLFAQGGVTAVRPRVGNRKASTTKRELAQLLSSSTTHETHVRSY